MTFTAMVYPPSAAVRRIVRAVQRRRYEKRVLTHPDVQEALVWALKDLEEWKRGR